MPLQILLIEDDADDIDLLEEAFRENKISYNLDVIMQGDKVTPYLSNVDSLPQVIVLDFNLPKLHGREVLNLIKTSPVVSDIPVVVLTTSTAREDMEFALNNGAAHFITKPTSIQEFRNAVNLITESAVKK